MAFNPSKLINDSKKKGENNSKPSKKLAKLPKEDVLNVVKAKGPVTPTQIKRELNAESYLISAILSELVSSNIINTTSVKKGTSIFYYLPSQTEKLEELTSYLNNKDQKTVELLKKKKVLEDKSQELFIRVSLRKIKDYAKPINIRVSEDDVKLFWKYYLVDDEEAKSVIRDILRPIIEKKGLKEKKDSKDKREKESKLPEKKSKTEDKTDKKKEEVKEKPKKSSEKKKDLEIKKPKESQLELNANIEDKLMKDNVFLKVKEKLTKNNIILESASSVRKGREFDMVILMDTPIGKTRFFAKYKRKKWANDADISKAVVMGQAKRLPIVFITSGELSKKAKKQADKLFKNVTIVEGF